MLAPNEQGFSQTLAERMTELLLRAFDVNTLAQRIDLNVLLDRIDVNELIKRVDVQVLLDRVDVNDLVQRIDMNALVAETDLSAVITRSSGGLATEALDAVRSQAVGLDRFIDRWVDRVLRVVRVVRLRRRAAASGSAPASGSVSRGGYAGPVSRFAAYAIDLVVSSGLFALALAAISYAAVVVTGLSIAWNHHGIVTAIAFACWYLLYFGYSWAANGRTFGMAVVGLRVVAADGAALDAAHGIARAFAFPLSFLFFGLGFVGILVQREHRALHDFIASTAVVYAWEAHAARLRFLVPDADATIPRG